MKITIALGAFFPVPPTMGGGVEKVWFSLAPEFAKRGHDVVMISRKISALPEQETIAGVKHVRVHGFDTPASLLWLKILDLIYSFRARAALPPADIVVTNTFWLPLLLRDPQLGKIYVHVGRYPKGQMRLYGRAARLQAPSHAVASRILAEAPTLAEKVRAIPYPLTTAASELPRPISGRDKIVLFVGRVHPEKGVHLLVDAFVTGARSALADWKLMIIGPAETKLGGGGEAYLRTLQQAAEPAKDKITFGGPIFDAERLADVYRNARLFVYPSLSERGESFGLAPLEAMAHGCAVLVSDLQCFHDFIQDAETGFVFDYRGPAVAESFRSRLENVLSDEQSLARVAQSGHRKSAEYSVERVADRFLSDFEEVQKESG